MTARAPRSDVLQPPFEHTWMSDEADPGDQTWFYSGGEKTTADENTGMLWVGVNTKWMGVSPIHEGYYLNMWQLRRAARARFTTSWEAPISGKLTAKAYFTSFEHYADLEAYPWWPTGNPYGDAMGPDEWQMWGLVELVAGLSVNGDAALGNPPLIEKRVVHWTAPAQTQEGYVWYFDDSLQSSDQVGVWIVGPEDNSQVLAGHTYEFMVGIRGCAQVPFDQTAATSFLSWGPIGGIDPPPDEWHAAGSVLLMGSTFVDRIEITVDPTG